MLPQEFMRFQSRNRHLQKIYLSVLTALLCCGLYLYRQSIPAAYDLVGLVNSQVGILLFLITAVIVGIIFGLLKKRFEILSVLFGIFILLIFSTKNQNNLSIIKYGEKEHQQIMNIINHGEVKEVDAFIRRNRLTLPETAVGYLKAQVEVNTDRKGNHLEATVKRLRQGDQTLNGYDAETLYVLERTYDGQVLSRPGQSFQKHRMRILQWLFLPAAVIVGCLALLVTLRFREAFLKRKMICAGMCEIQK